MPISPIVFVRAALEGPPDRGSLAEPILARDLGELRRRLERARLRGGRYSCLDFSPHVRDLMTRLAGHGRGRSPARDADAAVPGTEKVH